MAVQGSERCDPAEARRRDRASSGGQIAQPDRGVQTAHLADEARGWPGMQSVAVGDCEHRHHIRRFTSGRRGWRCVFWIAQLSVFAHKCVVGFGGDFLAAGSASGRHGSDNQSFDEGCR
jgi:hypothetical protein